MCLVGQTKYSSPFRETKSLFGFARIRFFWQKKVFLGVGAEEAQDNKKDK
jgi:hypothetical protein